MSVSESATIFERLPRPETATLTQFDPRPLAILGTIRPAPAETAFGPFRLLPTQFLLLEGDKPVSLGSRALEILIVLLERPGELISKQELMDRVWPNVFVAPPT